MDLLLAIVLIVLAFLGGALGGMYLVRKQIEKEFADNPRWTLRQFVLSWVQMVKSQAKPRYNKFTTKLSANKKQPLLTIKRNK